MTRIDPCDPRSQKCVSSLNDGGYPGMPPVPFTCSPEEAVAAVRRVVASMPRTTVEVDDGPYMSVVVRTRLLRFKDRVEVEVDAEDGVVHFTSYSTLGFARDDLNANRSRMEQFSQSLRAQLPAA